MASNPSNVRLGDVEKQCVSAILKEREHVLMAFPYGSRLFNQNQSRGWGNEPSFFDYFVITNRRVLVLTQNWFKTKEGLREIYFEIIKSADVREQVMGTTLLIRAEGAGGENVDVVCDNCPKREGEQAMQFLRQVMGKNLCPECYHAVKKEFTYCPYCEFPLKPVCPQCRRVLEEGWKICPYCGRK